MLLSGPVNVSAGVTVSQGTLSLLGGSNNFAGGVNVNAGTLTVQTDANLGASQNAISIAGGTLQLDGNVSTSRNIVIGSTGGAIDVTSGNTGLLSGGIVGGSTLHKSGAGTLRLTTSNSFTGAIQLDAEGGTLSLAAQVAKRPWQAQLRISRHATMQLDNRTAFGGNDAHGDRIGNASTVVFNGGVLSILGVDGASSTESAGIAALSSGASIIQVLPGAAGSAQLSFAAIVRTIGSNLDVQGVSLGTSAKVMINTQSPGSFPGWIKANGLPAKYDPIAGIVPQTFPAPGPSAGLVYGDANLDGLVNTEDFTAVSQSFGIAGDPTWSNGDFNADNAVTLSDVYLLQSNFGATVTSPVVASLVPEPLILSPFILVALTLLRVRCRCGMLHVRTTYLGI